MPECSEFGGKVEPTPPEVIDFYLGGFGSVPIESVTFPTLHDLNGVPLHVQKHEAHGGEEHRMEP